MKNARKAGLIYIAVKRMNALKIYFVLLIIITLGSCRAMKGPDYKGIDSFRVDKISGDTSTISLNVRYYNPNKYRLKLKEAQGDAYIDSLYLGHFSMDTMIKIAKYSDFTVPVILRANMKNIYQNAFSVLLNKEFNIRLEGECRVGKGAVFFPYPIRYEGKQALKLF